ncbi:DEAD/DEAH box helicase [Paracoccus tegillarcae]|uniref:DEAD-box ATP-dependent RNA helicase RhpA n=1 Tax=Paracoccus tegillarcae TaxID=1529068 RepID=A0A2K9EZ85_9RHOB|nr:DEAD/DEAH box helicase [Paracoccus tegillarcae]
MTKFADLKLDLKVLKAIAEAGYENPTPIQAGAIPPALEGRDVLGIAQTGTGKTASFTLPMITLLGRGRARARMPRSLVLCPTRELAAQVAENFDTYAKHTKLTKALLIGGVSFGEQDKLIDRGVDVLIATPGRLLDHFERGKLLLTGVQIMVVDEADRMLDMGFIPDIERIFQLTPFTRQTLFFSATMAPEIERITNTFLHSPERIEVARQATTSETITQRLIQITPTRRDQTAKQKRELLRALIDAEGTDLKNAIIFCNRKTDVDIVAKSLKKHGYDAAPIHGDLDQSQRMRTLDGFRDGSLRFLIASDVAARGLDIPAVSHVINFDLPSHSEDYVHRIGRTGRAGLKGTAISLSTPSDEKYLTGIENLVKQSLPRGELPEGFSLSEGSQAEPRSSGKDDRRGNRGGRGRDRDRSSSRSRRSSEDNATASEEKAAPAAASAQPETREEQPQPQPRAAERKTDRSSDRNSDRNSDRKQDSGRDDRRNDRRDGGRDGGGRDRRRDQDRGNDVIGMGNHVPEFLTQSFRTSDLMPEGIDAETETAEAHSDQEPAEKPKRSRRKKAAPKPDAETGTETGTEAQAADASTADTAAAPEADAAAEKPKKPTRSRRKSPAKKDADTAEAGADTAAAPEAQAEADKPAEKPKRTRRKKTDADAQAAAPADQAAADSSAEPAPDAPAKPRRTRRKKTDESASDQA